jgi:hypothetical protein
MNSADMFSLVPNPDDLLSSPTEERGRLILRLLSAHNNPRNPISHHNFFNRANDFANRPKYGSRQKDVDEALLEAWPLLESRGFLIKAPASGGDWFYVGKAGREFAEGKSDPPASPTPIPIPVPLRVGVKVATPGDLELIADSRLDELRALTSPAFDFQKLIRVCEELNVTYREGCYFATAMLTRSLLDHVPPLFGKKSFDEVASNYGGKSFKGTMQHLQNASRNVADGHLHQQIRKSETLPTAQQVNAAQQLDALLDEIVRITREKGGTP